MARFKRRKPRVLWLPVHGTLFDTTAESDSYASGLTGSLTLDQTGATATDIQAVTFDYSDSASNEEGTDFRSLQDLTSGNAYRLRRIVGKIWVAAVTQNNSETEIGLADVCCGFIINRTDDDGNPLYTFVTQTNAGPIAQDAAQDPWIWRRRWLLSPVPAAIQYGDNNFVSNLAALNTLTGFQGQFPQTTAGYGSVADGPHIDQKTARVISNQERLHFWIQGRIINASPNVNNVDLKWYLDVRLLASLRQNLGNRRNASR